WHSHSIRQSLAYRVFFFDDTASTEIYTLSYTTLFRSQRLAGCCGPGGRRRSATAAAASAAAVGENGVGLHYCGRPPGTDGGQPGGYARHGPQRDHGADRQRTAASGRPSRSGRLAGIALPNRPRDRGP